MTREEAEHEADRRNKERTAHQWFARAGQNGDWSLVKVPRLGGPPIDPLKATTEAKPKPPQADDPRPNYWRNVGGPWVG